MNIEARLERIEERLERIEERLPRSRLKLGRHKDPKFPRILRLSMQERGLSGSDLAALMWGRAPNRKGSMVAKGRDRISVWLAGKSYPSDRHMALLAQFVDIV